MELKVMTWNIQGAAVLSWKKSLEIKQELIDKNFLIVENDKLQVTDIGYKYLNDNLKRLNIKGKETWILPQENYYTTPISSTDVILPKKI